MAIYQTGDTPDEIWYDVVGFPGYQFSSDWRVRTFWRQGPPYGLSPDRWRIKKPRIHASGYPSHSLRRDGKNHEVYLHRMVAALAYGEVPDDLQVLHSDDDKTNCFPSNLTLGTDDDNKKDAAKNGRIPMGGQHYRTNLTEDNVREIRRLHVSGVRQRRIAEQFGVKDSRVFDIVHRNTWKHIA